VPHVWDIFGASKNEAPCLVDILIPLNGDISAEWAFRVFNLELDGVYKCRWHRGDSCDAARQCLVDESMKVESEWLLFLDSDVLPPANILKELMSHNLPIVSGIYNAKNVGLDWSMWRYEWVNNEEQVTVPVKKWDGRLIEVDTVGAGCILVKKDVLRDIKSKFNLPMFLFTKYRPEAFMKTLDVPDERMRSCSEDFWFCLLAKACGYKIMVDTEMKCAHYGRFKVYDGRIDPGVM
jgi:hypothetical protein